eukprot:15450595-Alexandrium_andersonii.AAC.1
MLEVARPAALEVQGVDEVRGHHLEVVVRELLVGRALGVRVTPLEGLLAALILLSGVLLLPKCAGHRRCRPRALG